MAANISHMLGIGLQYAYKEYTSTEDYPFDFSSRIDKRIEKLVGSVTDENCRALGIGTMMERPVSASFSEMALQKATSVLDVAHTLAQQGSLLESAVLCRACLEKLSLAIAVCQDATFSDPYSAKSTKSILAAKKAIPSIGPFYGLLSNLAHWDGSMHMAFLADLNGRAGVLVTSCRHKAIALVIVCLAAIALQDGGEFVIATNKRASAALNLEVRSSLIAETANVLKLLAAAPDPFDTTELIERLVQLHGEISGRTTADR